MFIATLFTNMELGKSTIKSILCRYVCYLLEFLKVYFTFNVALKNLPQIIYASNNFAMPQRFILFYKNECLLNVIQYTYLVNKYVTI